MEIPISQVAGLGFGGWGGGGKERRGYLFDSAYGVNIDPCARAISSSDCSCVSPPAFSPLSPFSRSGSTTLRPYFEFLQFWAPTGRVVTLPGMPCPRSPPVPPGSHFWSGRGASFSAGCDAPCGRLTRWTNRAVWSHEILSRHPNQDSPDRVDNFPGEARSLCSSAASGSSCSWNICLWFGLFNEV